MIRLGIAGACGRMGQRIGLLASQDGDFKILGALERDNNESLGKDYGQVLGAGDLGVNIQADARKVIGAVDVLVDFAIGSDVLTHVSIAKESKRPIVIGTTGLNGDGMKQIKEAARTIPCVLSPNMSPGINLLLDVLGTLGEKLGAGYDIEIVEKHHRMKKDWPSGTALKLAEAIAVATGRKISKTGAARSADEIVLHSLRGGDIVGDHTIVFAGNGEMIEVTHRATSRDTFAMGALRAAKFAVKAKPGLYNMLDVMRVDKDSTDRLARGKEGK